MRLFITAKPRAKEERVEKIDEAHYAVSVKEPPEGGRANEAIRKILAGYFGVSVSRLSITSGRKSKNKVVEVRTV